jgi:aryl carrier-like protein
MNVGRASSGALWIVKPTNVDCLVPIGAPGELLLEGPNIGEGYINDPVRTQAVFLERIPSWFSRKDYNGFIHPAKFYLTGDIVKYAPDGSILFIRRKDNQTKIRGQRVELGDIENHLATVADLGHHMVLIPSSGLLHKNLVAVFSVEKTTAFQNIQESARLTVLHHSLGEKVRSLIDVANKSLSTQLPSHMVPNFWVPVESLPVLSSGKLDRQRVCTWLEGLDEQTWEQLIALAATPAESEENLTNEESCLRDLWHQVLNVDLNVINSRSAFLQLGGDSISAMQLMSKARDAGLYLSMLNITKSKSLRELAISAIPITNSTNMVKGFETEPTETLFDLSPVQKLYFSITPEGNNEFEQSILLKCSQNLSASVLSNTVNRIVEHHSQLRARYTQIRGCWM